MRSALSAAARWALEPPFARSTRSLRACSGRLLLALLVLGLLAACAPSGKPAAPEPAVLGLRRDVVGSSQPELLARWLLAELFGPHGTARGVLEARRRLDAAQGQTMLSHLARALDDSLHGRLDSAPNHFLRAAREARGSESALAPVVGWLAIEQALSTADDHSALWRRWGSFAEDAIERPGALGWRARAALVDWWADEAWKQAEHDIDQRSARRFGCTSAVRVAGPFGRGVDADAWRSFAAEAPGPWPARWPIEPHTGLAARQLATKSRGCVLETDEASPPGIYYAETFLELDQERDVLVAIQGALSVRIDDRSVLERDPREWGVWPRFGVLVRLGPGRHRLLARLASPSTVVRVMQPDGTPLDAGLSLDESQPYSLTAPKVLDDPNVLMRYVRDGRVVAPESELTRVLVAYLAQLEGQADLASVLIEPLVAKPDHASGAALAAAAGFTEQDPIFEAKQSKDLVRELQERAVRKDSGLWGSQLALALGEAERKGPLEGVRALEQLAQRFARVPAVRLALARSYGSLGWSAARARTVEQLLAAFPDNQAVLHAGIDLLEARGQHREADRLVQRVVQQDRDSELLVTRALQAEDYERATHELRRRAARHPESEELAERIADLQVRAGSRGEPWARLEAKAAKDPTNGRTWLELADARLASGQERALEETLASATERGADSSPLTEAIDRVAGMTELEPYRLDGRRIIAEYERAGRHMPGTAARVLDYAAIWVHSDGSSRMLEHEIIRIQSAEAIDKFAEERRLEGVVLAMRVLKQDGSVLEPELVEGKPTVTFPHLEVGDYIETEHVMTLPGDDRGQRYLGPRWFFREADVAYARSELVLIVPEQSALEIETQGQVPPPQLRRHDGLVERRWRVDFSPAAPVEPNSVPPAEFLPSVRYGWGITLEHRLQALTDAVAWQTPLDPRIVRIAERIVEGTRRSDVLERARRLYRWVLDNVERGNEADGRRVIIGKNGNQWRGYMMLCRAAGVPVAHAVAESRLAPPAIGPISRAETLHKPLLLVGGERDGVWLTLGDKFAPFGYVPAEARDMRAYLLVDGATRPQRVTQRGALDGLSYTGTIEVAADGSAKLRLVQRFSGEYGMKLREALASLADRQLHDALESGLLARALQGARLTRFALPNREAKDEPLEIELVGEISRFAQRSGDRLIVSPPFGIHLGQLATLPRRQTPLLLPEALHREVDLSLVFPKGSVVVAPPAVTLGAAERQVRVEDSVKGHTLRLKRTLHIPAGRIPPPDYPSFSRFVHQGDDALDHPISVRLSH